MWTPALGASNVERMMLTLEQLSEEVKILSEQIVDICKKDEEINSLYLGTQIYFSPIKKETDLMFIGINPGAGFYNGTGKRVMNFCPLEKSEYETEEYNLQNDWVTIFGDKYEINNLELLFNSFKTNCSFFATKDSKSLTLLKSKLKKYFGNKIENKEKEWISKIIDYVDPKLIICEGFAAYNNLLNLISNKDIKVNETEKGNVRCSYLNNYIPIVGFKRNISSRFVDIEEVVDTLLSYMQNIQIL